MNYRFRAMSMGRQGQDKAMNSPHTFEQLHGDLERELRGNRDRGLEGKKNKVVSHSEREGKHDGAFTWFTHGHNFRISEDATDSRISIEMSSSIPTPGPVAIPENSTSSWSSVSEQNEHGVFGLMSRSLLALSATEYEYNAK